MNFLNLITKMLSMEWLNILTTNLLTILNIDTSSKLGESINFFIYETIKILLLLIIIVFIISFIQSYFPPEKTKKILSKYAGFKGNIVGAILGILSPFCSCSSIPLFVGLNKTGVPIGVSFSFLICSPLVDMASLIFLMSLFGFKIGIAYVSVGVLLAVIGGFIIEKLNLQSHINIMNKENNRSCCNKELNLKIIIKDNNCCSPSNNSKNKVAFNRISQAKQDTINLVKNIWKYILISIAIGTLIHSWIPQNAILKVLGENNPLSVLIATFIGIPLYTDEMSAIVIGKAFYSQGVQIGTILSFMMSAAALSIPSIIMLRSILSKKLLAIFISIITIGIIFIGYLFNLLSWIF